MADGLPTLARVKEALSYNEETGVFTWRKLHKGLKASSNLVAGTKHNAGYVTINIDRKLILAHRLAWFYVHGEWPPHFVDHINRVRNDNRIANLRLANKKQNMENQNLRCNNTSGHKGVDWDRARSKWRVQIRHNGKGHCIGRFSRLEDAILARQQAEHKFFTHHEVTV